MAPNRNSALMLLSVRVREAASPQEPGVDDVVNREDGDQQTEHPRVVEFVRDRQFRILVGRLLWLWRRIRLRLDDRRYL